MRIYITALTLLITSKMNHLGDIDNANRPQTQEQALVNPGSESTPGLPKMCHAFSRYRKYLHSYYNRYPIVRDDKLSIAPCNQFINLALVKEDDTINFFTKSTLHGGVDEIKKSKIPVEMDAIVTSDSQFVLVEGPPGIGKSTLCWELCRQWDTLKSLKDYKIVLQLKLRERRVQNASSLQEIFYNRDNELSHNVVKEVCRCEGEGVLLIFDGFDEMPTSIVQDKDNLLMELISGTSLPRATRLVTSRPSALHHKEECFPQNRHIEILGFISDESKVRYAEFAFKSEPEVLASFKKFIFSNPIIRSLMYIPVNCAIISQVYKDIRRSRKLMPKTMTQLYSTLIPVLIKRYMIEKGEWNSHHGIPGDLKDLPEEFVFALNRVSELAYNGLFKGDIQLVFTESDVRKDFQHLGLLIETKEMYVCEGAVSSYSFLHLSIQEFLAAWHVKCHPEIAIANSHLIKMNPHPSYVDEVANLTTFGLFVAGLIGYDIFKFCYYNYPEFLIMCMYEAQDCSQLSYQNKYTFRILSNPMEMYAFGYVLVHAPIQWHLSFTTGEPPPFDVLESSLSDHASSTNQIQGSIVQLSIVSYYLSHVDPKLLFPPKCLLHSLIELKFRSLGYVTASKLSQVLRDLDLHEVNLKNIEIELDSDDSYRGDYILYRFLRQFPINNFKLSFKHITLKGMEELTALFSNSHTIEDMMLKHVSINYQSDNYKLERSYVHRLVGAVLSCSSVKSFVTNILFQFPPGHHYLEAMTFLIPMIRNPAALLDCLLRIAEMCKVQSMKSLEIYDETYCDYAAPLPYSDYCNFLSILNDSLHHNPSMCSINFDMRAETSKYFDMEELPHISCKESVTVRRTKSLSDIDTAIPENGFDIPAEDDSEDDCPERSTSCLNLLSLHNIHPLLKETLVMHSPPEPPVPTS